jgi:cytochrome P450
MAVIRDAGRMPAMRSVREIPQAPGAIPLLGHAVPFVRDSWRFVGALWEDGPLVRVRIGAQSMVIVCDPDLTRQILLDSRTYDKGGILWERGRELLGNGLASCMHSQHRRLRRLCQPAFNPDRLSAYSATQAMSAVALADSWRPGQVIDVYEEMIGLFVRGMIEKLFGSALPPSAEGKLAANLITLLDGLFVRMVSPALLNRLPTPSNRRYHRANAQLRRTAEEVIASRRAAPGGSGDLLSALLTASDPEGASAGRCLDDTELVDQVMTFFFGASDTTASTVAWALSLLAAHPEVERRAQAEVDRVLGGGIPTPQNVADLELLGRVVTETLRLYPIAWLFSRTVTQDTELGGFDLTAGTDLVISPYLIHRRPDIYPEPDRFEPDRWRDSPPNRTAYLPFGAGARKCIGDRLALAEATLILAAIMSRWQLVPATTQPVRPKKFPLAPRRLRMRVRERIVQS